MTAFVKMSDAKRYWVTKSIRTGVSAIDHLRASNEAKVRGFEREHELEMEQT